MAQSQPDIVGSGLTDHTEGQTPAADVLAQLDETVPSVVQQPSGVQNMPAMSESPTPPDIDRSSPESKHLEERRGPARPYTPPNDPNSPRRDSRGRADFSPSLHIPRRNTHVIVRPPIVESYRGRDSSPVRTEYGGDEDDTVSVRSALATRTLKAARPSQRVITKSQKISSIQNVFSESQKIAYVGLCYLSVVHHPKADVKGLKKANDSYSTWADHFMEKLYVFLDIKSEERSMIKSLAEHGLVPSDLSKSLIDDAKKAAAMISERQEKRQRAEEEAMEKGLPFDFDDSQENGVDDAELTDIRFTILTHLFILCIMDGQYDSRSRTVLRSVAQYLEIPWADVVRLEGAIADQLRIYEDSEEVKGDVEIVGKRNRADTKNRWLFTGIATLAGGAVIGLTAGLAAPLIAGGIGVALGTFGVTGATAALSTTGALALITTGGVLTGGGMGGVKMMKRTKGITQFEFLYIEDGLRMIEENKEKRRTERRKRRRREAREALHQKLDQQKADKEQAQDAAKGEAPGEPNKGDDAKEVYISEASRETEEEPLPRYEAMTQEKFDRIGNWVNTTSDQRMDSDSTETVETPSRSLPPPIPRRPTAAELEGVATARLSVSGPSNPARRSRKASAVDTSAPTSAADEGRHIAPEWGMEEGFTWPDTEPNPNDDLHGDSEPADLSKADSTLLWDSRNQLVESDYATSTAHSRKQSFDAGSLGDVGTIDEEMAAVMFDDLQSTIAGDEVDEDGLRFKEPEGPPKAKQTNVLITVAGWITYGPDDHTLPFSTMERDIAGDQYALAWETDTLQELGSALKLLVGEVASFLVQQGLSATVLSTLMLGLAGPLWVMKLSYLVDNPWGIGLSKANKAGKILADTLIQGVQDNRPVTLIGYSLGARVIFHCLLELASRGAYGIVEEVYLLGCPVMAQKKEWEQISSVVSGRLVNGYSTNDMVLGVLYRASVAVWNNVAGLRPVEGVAAVENISLDDVIQGHLDYRLCMPKVLEKLGFPITKDYFDDEDEEEERERLELEEEQKREKEERLRAKEERLKKKQEEYEEKVRKKKEEQERKQREREERDRLKQEQRAAELASAGSQPRRSWFSRRSIPPPTPKTPTEATDDIDEQWTPKEIQSTLPPLVITADEDQMFVPKEIQSTLPPLVIRTIHFPEDVSGASTPQTTGVDELAEARSDLQAAQAEVDAAKKEVHQARRAVAAATLLSKTAAQQHPAEIPKIATDLDDEYLKKVLLAAGPSSAGAGDLLDSHRAESPVLEDPESATPTGVPPVLEDQAAWRIGTPDRELSIALPFTAASPGGAVSNTSDVTSSNSAFVDAEENPWSG